MNPPLLDDGMLILERMVRAVEKVKQRLLRATAALEAANVPYAVIGGNAVAAWVARVDEAAVRNTRDVDLLVRRSDLDAVKEAMARAGFTHHETLGVHMFLEEGQSSARDAVHVLFANEKVQDDYVAPTPDVADATVMQAYRVLNLEPLVRMKLTSFRDKDRTHLRDLIELGQIDATWPARFPHELAARLQHLLDTPGR
jgi:hypothetical protein